MRNVSEKSYRENQNTPFMFNKVFFFANRAVYEMMWKNIVDPDRPLMTIWRMLIACLVPRTADTNSEYVIPIAFLQQQWLYERASMLRYTYIARLVSNGW